MNVFDMNVVSGWSQEVREDGVYQVEISRAFELIRTEHFQSYVLIKDGTVYIGECLSEDGEKPTAHFLISIRPESLEKFKEILNSPENFELESFKVPEELLKG